MHDTFQFGVIVLASYDEYTTVVKSGNVVSKHVNGWKVIETSDSKLRVIWHKRRRILMENMSECSTRLQKISTSAGTRLEGVVGLRILVDTCVP